MKSIPLEPFSVIQPGVTHREITVNDEARRGDAADSDRSGNFSLAGRLRSC